MPDPTPLTRELLRALPLPGPEGGDKEGRGRVLVVAGSLEVPGAALLAGAGVLRAGAGKLQIATCRGMAPHLGAAMPEARVVALPETRDGGIAPDAAETLIPRARQCAAVLVGPGMMDQDAVAALTAALLDGLAPDDDDSPEGAESPALVLDAAALDGLLSRRALLRRHRGRVVLTPHAGEMAGLLGIGKDAVEADPAGVAVRAAAELGAVVALKGARTRIAAPDGTLREYRGGSIGLATSGSGDVLAGIIAGLLGRGASAEHAALWGVYLHGEAGSRLARAQGPVGFLARELPAEIPGILAGFAPDPGA